MKVILFGATGMLGQGVLHVALRDPGVDEILVIGRTPIEQQHAKLREIVHGDLMDLTAIEGQLVGYDACFFCLGTSAVGMSEADYRRVTYDFTLSVAQTLARLNPESTFIYVSGAGTDSTEHGRLMWARVKGETENAVLALPLDAYMFRPGLIQPLRGVKSKTRLYRTAYSVAGPLMWAMHRVAPGRISTTDQIAEAMIAVANHGAPKKILENSDIRAAAESG
ncbi:NAD(P)H-binding protein [Antrihabitans cavernicola]|uniref:NAD-dependent epimerase/dehydratase family protein n=1 Tax=Antrihabitans cavernicola TaxID=2495913 RepID=A0A5A7SAT1_9NOCA|nr:NAD(P)H-binding protein [Spelaeibacter cavernicola]KAA0021967.1 NAD-dependent epimerase/dehydratase family protein [Spelaeibacter cavernicola]